MATGCPNPPKRIAPPELAKAILTPYPVGSLPCVYKEDQAYLAAEITDSQGTVLSDISKAAGMGTFNLNLVTHMVPIASLCPGCIAAQQVLTFAPDSASSSILVGDTGCDKSPLATCGFLSAKHTWYFKLKIDRDKKTFVIQAALGKSSCDSSTFANFVFQGDGLKLPSCDTRYWIFKRQDA